MRFVIFVTFIIKKLRFWTGTESRAGVCENGQGNGKEKAKGKMAFQRWLSLRHHQFGPDEGDLREGTCVHGQQYRPSLSGGFICFGVLLRQEQLP